MGVEKDSDRKKLKTGAFGGSVPEEGGLDVNVSTIRSSEGQHQRGS